MYTSTNRLTLFIAVAALLVAALAFGVNLASAQRTLTPGVTTTPTIVSYQGRVLSAGVPFNGTGFFKFAVVNAAGDTSYWSNDGTSSAGSQPSANVPVAVSNGLFTVMLGDTSLGGMLSPLTASVFSAPDRSLRIWFSSNALAFTQLTPDQQIASVPFAFNAQTLGGLDESTFVQQAQLAASGYITQGLADNRYARNSPTTQQIAMLKWYTAISGTQADFSVGSDARSIAFDGTNMWVANFYSNTLSVLRASDGFHVMTPTVGAVPWGMAFDGANMWVANTFSNSVSVLRASDGFHVMTPTVGIAPQGIAFDGTNMWVAGGDYPVSVLRASDGFHVMTPTTSFALSAIAFDGANMWLVSNNSHNVSVLRASDGFHVMTVDVGSMPRSIAFDGTNMWVGNNASNNVSVVRASDGYHVMTPTVGAGPWGIAFDGTNMWVVNSGSGSVSVLRASDGLLVRTPSVGNNPTAIAFDGAFIWAASFGSASVSKR
jgi:hypothetical protein